MAETRSMLLNEAVVRETEEVLGRFEQAIAEQNQKLDESFAKLIGAIRLISDNVNDVSSCGHLQQKRSSPVVSMTPETVESLGFRIKKIQRPISLEEIDEGRSKGLCLFCEEPETPDHYLQHKNSGICMIDNDEEDRFLSDSAFVENEIEKDLVEIGVAKSNDDNQLADAGDVFGFNVEVSESDSLFNQSHLIQEQAKKNYTDLILETSLLQQRDLILTHQVPPPHWEIFRRSSMESMDVNDESKAFHYVYDDLPSAIVRTHQWQSQFVLEYVGNIACQVFDIMSLGTRLLQSKRRKTFLKTWWFKFKATSQPRELIQGEPGTQELKKDNSFQDLRERDQTGEIVASNEKRSVLCTENKEEVKGYFDCLQSLVLMKGITDSSSNDEELMKEEHSLKVYEVERETQIFDSGQWLGYDLIITYLENKNNWSKLRVKKWENLSWKEAASDESWSISIRCIMKLEGAAFICKNVLERIHNENLEILACQARLEGSVLTKLIGMDRSKRLGSSEISSAMDDLRNQESPEFFVSQQVTSNTKIKFSKRWWFKYKFGEAGLTRQSSSNLYMTYYFAVWHCWKNKTMVCVERSGEHWSWMDLDRKSATSSFLLFLYDQRMGVPGQGYNFILYRDHQGRCRLKQSKRLIQGELVKTGKLSKIRLNKHHMSQYLWKSWCSTVLYGYFLWEHSDKGTQLLCSRRLVVYKIGSEAKNVVQVSQRVYWTVEREFAKVERKLEVTQRQIFDPGIGLESQETLRRTMEETTWELPLFCSDNFQTNLVVKVFRRGEI